MTDINSLKQLLQANGIDSAKYDNNTLQTLISQAKTLINIPELKTATHEEYSDNFHGKTYVTRYTPIDTNNVHITQGETVITPRKVTTAGVIYFETTITGELEITYNTGIPDSEVDDCLNLIVLYMIQDNESITKNGGMVNSINEGDVSVSYNNNVYSDRITSFITDLKNKYSTAQVFYI